jgi:hypothetical protein
VFSTTCSCEFGAIFYAVTTIIIHWTVAPNFIACSPKNFVGCSLPGPLRLLVPTFFSIVFQMLLLHASEFLFVVSAKICGSSTAFSFRFPTNKLLAETVEVLLKLWFCVRRIPSVVSNGSCCSSPKIFLGLVRRMSVSDVVPIGWMMVVPDAFL